MSAEPKKLTGEAERMSAEERDEFVLDMIRERVYIAHEPDAVRSSFGLILAMVDMDAEYAQSIAWLAAPLAKAMPRMLNGYPMFSEVQFVHRADAELIWEAYKAKRALMGDPVPEPPAPDPDPSSDVSPSDTPV